MIVFLAGIICSLTIGWWVFPQMLYRSEPQPVQFSHSLHTSEKVGMSCQDCHSLNDHGTFAGIPKLEKCASCHAEPVVDTETEKRFVEEYVKQNREVPWGVYARQPDNAYFSHVYHVKMAKIQCERCHGGHATTEVLRPLLVNRVNGYSRDIWGSSISGVKSQPWDGMKMSDCIDCHKEHQQGNACIDCHK